MRRRMVHDAPPREDGDYVLYWMTMARRPAWNHALDRAARWAARLAKPLLVLEALRLDYPWASERLHRFILQGMRDNAAAFATTPAFHYAYVEREAGQGKGLLAALAARACVVVGDDYPAFMLPRMAAAAAAQVPCRFELLDSNGLYPMRATQRVFGRAVDFRRHLQKELAPWLAQAPRAQPFEGLSIPSLGDLPEAVLRRWPAARGDLPALAAQLRFPHAVPPSPMEGGRMAGLARLEGFVPEGLARYLDERNEPELEGTSRLSPYLHFGHVASHEVFDRIARAEGWTPERLAPRATGSREGWWGMGPAAEAFLDQLVTWRELGFNYCALREDTAEYESLPAWARASLEAHAADPRPWRYSLAELEAAKTHDPLWNAAQRQLLREGWMHNYLRMLWGKKILEWSAHPREAHAAMIALMDKHALDGRDPNSYSGYAWTLGRYDRPWGPERPIFGAIRYMSSDNTARKFSVKGYLARYGETQL